MRARDTHLSAYTSVAFARGLDLNSPTMLRDRLPELIAFALFVVT
jgi:hypothetical protein